jgi:ribosomal-protein-alanine N-acetyltransferase
MIYRLNDDYFVRALQEADVAGAYPSWFEDQEVCRYNSHGKFFKTSAYFRSWIEALDNEDRVVWAICHNTDGHIGNISLQIISFINRNAEFAIILGDKRHWGKGVARIAGEKLIAHGFDKLNLERIYCGTAANNLAMRKLAVALGMLEEGCRRSHLYLDGSWVDVVEYGLLRSDARSTKASG